MMEDGVHGESEKVVRNYLRDNHDLFDKLEYSEKLIEIGLGDGVRVNGRIDLAQRVDDLLLGVPAFLRHVSS